MEATGGYSVVNSNLAHKLDNENTIDVETNDIPLNGVQCLCLMLFFVVNVLKQVFSM